MKPVPTMPATAIVMRIAAWPYSAFARAMVAVTTRMMIARTMSASAPIAMILRVVRVLRSMMSPCSSLGSSYHVRQVMYTPASRSVTDDVRVHVGDLRVEAGDVVDVTV